MEQNKRINLGRYLQARNERNAAIAWSIVFALVYAAGGMCLALQSARYFTFVSLGNILTVSITTTLLLPLVTLVKKIEDQYPEWKKESSKEVPLSSEFKNKSFLVFSISFLALMFSFLVSAR